MMTNLNFLSILFLILVVVSINSNIVSATGGVFHVQHKFAGQQQGSLRAIKDHDTRRNQRLLYSTALLLRGSENRLGEPADTSVYYTTVKIGSPSREYYVRIDIRTDFSWIYCAECKGCPRTSGIGKELTPYDPRNSSSSRVITCDQEFCSLFHEGDTSHCKGDARCDYQMSYGDGNVTTGYFVKDIVEYQRVSGDYKMAPANSSVVFGCQLSQDLDDSGVAFHGVFGFRQSNLSIVSQMTAAGGLQGNSIAHCLNGVLGGGIFVVGKVVDPKVGTTKMVPKQGYTINLTEIMVGENKLPVPHTVLSTANPKQTLMDSGTTLSFLPDSILVTLIEKIKESRGDSLITTKEGDFDQCFTNRESLNTAFPTVTLIFEGSLKLVVLPEEYLFELRQDGTYCMVWQRSGSDDLIQLGALTLMNKLVVYDLENQTIGWTPFDCSSPIAVQDEQTSGIYRISTKNLSSAHSNEMTSIVILLLLSAICHTVLQL